ncbi:hypothetical protein J6590_082108 [Homalodisca vitripennis]|nr:hypothetical protein J6590_082108 [Homalodisca vitripennis]
MPQHLRRRGRNKMSERDVLKDGDPDIRVEVARRGRVEILCYVEWGHSLCSDRAGGSSDSETFGPLTSRVKCQVVFHCEGVNYLTGRHRDILSKSSWGLKEAGSAYSLTRPKSPVTPEVVSSPSNEIECYFHRKKLSAASTPAAVSEQRHLVFNYTEEIECCYHRKNEAQRQRRLVFNYTEEIECCYHRKNEAQRVHVQLSQSNAASSSITLRKSSVATIENEAQRSNAASSSITLRKSSVATIRKNEAQRVHVQLSESNAASAASTRAAVSEQRHLVFNYTEEIECCYHRKNEAQRVHVQLSQSNAASSSITLRK